MNDNVKAWVAALRSGTYTQGQFKLRRLDNTYCCLGVACDLAVQAGVSLDVQILAGGYTYDEFGAGLALDLTIQFHNSHRSRCYEKSNPSTMDPR